MNVAFYGYHWIHFKENRKSPMAKISIRSEDIIKVEEIPNESGVGYRIDTPFAQYYTDQDVMTLIKKLEELKRND